MQGEVEMPARLERAITGLQPAVLTSLTMASLSLGVHTPNGMHPCRKWVMVEMTGVEPVSEKC